MHYQSFFGVIFLFILVINSSLTLPYSYETMNQFDENDAEKISDEYDNNSDHLNWRRESELGHYRTNMMNKHKAGSPFLTYDFLLHRWVLRKTPN